MYSDKVAIKVSELSKCYTIYNQPRDRLKQAVIPKIQRALGFSISSYYREFWALKNVSFNIAKGEAIGIIGQNGSGKSTLLQLICGTLNPSSGEVITNGRIGALLELGAGFNPEFSGRENVFLNGAVLGLSRDEINQKFDAIASFADIGKFLEQPVKTYSSGMYVRLAFAVQACIEPEIMIVDEALAVGDALFQKRCYQQIERLRSKGTTLLFVSHDQESIRTLTERAILLRQGRIASAGTPAEVLLDYRRELHNAETTYFQQLAQIPDVGNPSSVTPSSTERSERMSFGDLKAEILDVCTLGANGESKSHFYPGETICIAISCRANIDLEQLNIAFRIRNKEGIKITSWGVLNNEIKHSFDLPPDASLRDKKIPSASKFTVKFHAPCTLGENFYEVQATVSLEKDRFYGDQQILHWKDEACFFTVTHQREKLIFGGICNLNFESEVILDAQV